MNKNRKESKIATYRVDTIIGLPYHWRVSLFGLFFVVIVSFICYFLLGHDVKNIYELYSKNLTWWMLLIIMLGLWIILMFITLLFIKKLRFFGFEVFNFIIPLSLTLYAFTVTSACDMSHWWIRLIVAILMFLTIVPTMLINKKIARNKLALKKQIEEEIRRKNKSLLD